MQTREASRHLRGEEKSGAEGEGRRKGEGQAGVNPDLGSQEGLKGGARRTVHHTLPAVSLATSPLPAQPFSFPSSRETRAGRSYLGFRYRAQLAALVIGSGEGHAPALEGWGGSVPAAGEWLSSSLFQLPYRSRRPEAPLDFQPAPATWACTGRHRLGWCGREESCGLPLVRPAHLEVT